MKFCRKCNIEKELKFFDIKNNQCKACVAKYQEEYRKNNKQKASQYGKEYKENNKERLSQSNKEYYIINKDKISEYVEKNKDKISQRNKEYYVNNKEKILNQHKTISKNRRKIDAAYRLRHDISGSIWYALKRNASSKAGESYLKYLPYTIQELKKHLESQFEPWMTWENRGHYKINEWDYNDQSTWRWQIDHIIPHSTFNYTSMDSQEFRDCWALNNLRPLSAKQNLIDGTSRIRH